jgi:hypothetical protein
MKVGHNDVITTQSWRSGENLTVGCFAQDRANAARPFANLVIHLRSSWVWATTTSGAFVHGDEQSSMSYPMTGVRGYEEQALDALVVQSPI